jgi:CheY-like chemotaxis protein
MSERPIVVIVEDEEDSREILKDLLEHHGHRVRTAANGQEALLLLDELGGEARVVLLDLFMPVLDGWQVYEQLKARGKLEALDVLITTSAPHRAPAGATVLEKPVNIPKLLEILAARCAAAST